MFGRVSFSSSPFSTQGEREGVVYLSSPVITANTAFEINYQRIRNISADIDGETINFIAFGGYLKEFTPVINVEATAVALPNVIWSANAVITSNGYASALGYILGEEWTDTTFGTDTWNETSTGVETWNAISYGSDTWNDTSFGNDTWTQTTSSSNTWNKKG